jgi:hypothetical protein
MRALNKSTEPATWLRRMGPELTHLLRPVLQCTRRNPDHRTDIPLIAWNRLGPR